jgi:hypothetical protein
VTQSNAASAEECASAAEELTAQAEALKGMVGDLVSLVSGGQGQQQSVVSGTFRRPGRPAAKAVSSSPRSSGGAQRQLATPASEGRKVMKPNEVIPLSDDFSDF